MISRSIVSPSGVITVVPARRLTTSSPVSSHCTRRVSERNADTSEARKFSPSPTPTTSGHSRRAPTSVSG
ncbi:MAG TPA: hypothetical protein VG458_02885, partial [Solirubrobacterales bacterium]|nr:hypothetical protein [Solirubrobacterales bacterium]